MSMLRVQACRAAKKRSSLPTAQVYRAKPRAESSAENRMVGCIVSLHELSTLRTQMRELAGSNHGAVWSHCPRLRITLDEILEKSSVWVDDAASRGAPAEVIRKVVIARILSALWDDVLDTFRSTVCKDVAAKELSENEKRWEEETRRASAILEALRETLHDLSVTSIFIELDTTRADVPPEEIHIVTDALRALRSALKDLSDAALHRTSEKVRDLTRAFLTGASDVRPGLVEMVRDQLGVSLSYGGIVSRVSRVSREDAASLRRLGALMGVRRIRTFRVGIAHDVLKHLDR